MTLYGSCSAGKKGLSMNLDTMIIVLPALSALIAILANIGALFYWAGKMKSTLTITSDALVKLDKENKDSHKAIYEKQEDAGIHISGIEEHLRSLNGSVARNTAHISECSAIVTAHGKILERHSTLITLYHKHPAESDTG